MEDSKKNILKSRFKGSIHFFKKVNPMSFEMTSQDVAEMIFLNGVAARAAYSHRRYNHRSQLPQMPFAENALVQEIRKVKPTRNRWYSEYLPGATYFGCCMFIAMEWDKQNDSALTDEEVDAVNDGTMFSKDGIHGAFLAHDWHRETKNVKQHKIVTPIDYYSRIETSSLMNVLELVGKLAVLELSKLLFGNRESKLDDFSSLVLFFIWEALEELWPSVYSFASGVDHEEVVPDEPSSPWEMTLRRLHAITYAESAIRFMVCLFHGQIDSSTEALRSLFELIYPNSSPQMKHFPILFEEEFLRNNLQVRRNLLFDSIQTIQAPCFFACSLLRGPFPIDPIFPPEKS